jgi:membrane protease YdiL (CAAX protease family)
MTIALLGLGGMVLSIGAPEIDPNVGQEDVAPEVENKNTFPVTVGAAVVAFASFMVLYWVLSPIGFSSGNVTYTAFFSTFSLPYSGSAQQMASDAFLVFCVPWGEENFFRALWGGLFIRYLPPGLAEVSSGIIFMVFHAAVYSLFLGPAWGLIGLLTGAGAVFVGADEASGDIGSSLLGHSAWNLSSVAVQGNIAVILFGAPPASLAALGASPLLVGALTVIPCVLIYKKKGALGSIVGRAGLRLGHGDRGRAQGSGGDSAGDSDFNGERPRT